MPITDENARDIADDLLAAANEINAFMDLKQTTRDQRTQLRQAAKALLRDSGSMTTAAVGLAIDEMRDESAELRDVIGRAQEKLETLERVAQAIRVASGLADLASAILGQDPGAVVKASRGLHESVTSG